MRKSALFRNEKASIFSACLAFIRKFLFGAHKKTLILVRATAKNSLLDDFFCSPEELEIFALFQKQVQIFFQNSHLNPSQIETYFTKIDIFLKTPFLLFYRSLPKETQQLLFTKNFFLENAAVLHESFAGFLKNIEQSTGGRLDIQETDFRVIHHILPKFDGGTDNESNCVFLHQYEHALIHLFRYLWLRNSRDLNAFSSACLTPNQIKRRNKGNTETQQIARQKTVLNPEWQATYGRKGVERSAELRRGGSNASALSRRANSETGKKFQYVNSRKRVHPWTWFLSEAPLTFTNQKLKQRIEIVPHEEVSKRTVTYLVSTLKRLFPHSSIPDKEGRYGNFAEVLRFEKNSYWGWACAGVRIDGVFFSFETPKKKKVLYIFFATIFFYLYCSPENTDVLSVDGRKFLKERVISVFGPLLDVSSSELSVFYEKIEGFVDFYKEYVPVGSTANAKIVMDLHRCARKDIFEK